MSISGIMSTAIADFRFELAEPRESGRTLAYRGSALSRISEVNAAAVHFCQEFFFEILPNSDAPRLGSRTGRRSLSLTFLNPFRGSVKAQAGGPPPPLLPQEVSLAPECPFRERARSCETPSSNRPIVSPRRSPSSSSGGLRSRTPGGVRCNRTSEPIHLSLGE